jgi:hypothetical protein
VECRWLKSTNFGGWEMRVRIPSGAPIQLSLSKGRIFGKKGGDLKMPTEAEVRQMREVQESLAPTSARLARTAAVLAPDAAVLISEPPPSLATARVLGLQADPVARAVPAVALSAPTISRFVATPPPPA